MDNTRKELTKQERGRIDDLLAEVVTMGDKIDPKGWEINEEQFDKYCKALKFCKEYAENYEGTVKQNLKPQNIGTGYLSMIVPYVDICFSNLNDFEEIIHNASCFGVTPHTDGTISVEFTIPDVLKPKASNTEWCEIKEESKKYKDKIDRITMF